MPLDCAATSCYQPFSSDGTRRYIYRGWGYISDPFPGWMGEGSIQAMLTFPSRLAGWEGLGGTLSLGCELNLLPLHSIRTSRLCLVLTLLWGNQLFFSFLPFCCSAGGLTASRSCHQPFWSTVYGAVTPLLAWAWANQTPGLTNLLV